VQLKAFARRGMAALAAFHGMGFAHADIKPGNMLLMAAGMGVADLATVVVADYDMATSAGQSRKP
jgi:serine/threonine protein kinase